MADTAHKDVDKQIKQIARELRLNYRECIKTLETKLHSNTDLLNALSEEDNAKRQRILQTNAKLQKMIEQFAVEIQNANKIAVDMVNDNLFTTYANNFNYGTYILEHDSGIDTDFNLYNRDSVKAIVTKDLTPFTHMAYDGMKDKNAIVRDLSRHITQAVMLGENPHKLAKRIQETTEKNYKQAMVIARTEMTRVQSKGRYDSFKRGQDMGLKLKKQWSSTIDQRTRDTHQRLNMETVEMDELFSNGLDFPAGTGPAKEVVNCRCTIVTIFDGYEQTEEELQLDDELKRMSFEEWGEKKQNPTPKEKKPNKPAYTFKEATTINEANEFALKLGIKNANYKGADLVSANEWNKGLADNLNRFPELFKNMQYVGTMQNKNKFAKVDEYTRSGFLDMLVKLNPRYTKKQLESVLDKEMKKFFVTKASWYAESVTIEGVKGITFNKKWGEDSKKWIASLVKDVSTGHSPQGVGTIKAVLDHELGHQLDDLLTLSKNKEVMKLFYHSDVAKEVGRYATNNIHEFIAETWAEYTNNPQPREMALKIGKLIEEEYKNKYGK